MKKMNIDTIYEGVHRVLSNQLLEIKEAAKEKIRTEVKLEEKYALFSLAIDKYPEIAEELTIARTNYVDHIVYEGVKNMDSYVPYGDRDIIKGRIAVMAPAVIHVHTLEEIADLVKI